MSLSTWLKSCINKSVYFRPDDNVLLLSGIGATGFQGSFNPNKYRTGYDLIHQRYVLAHEDDIWTNASYGFHTLAKDLAPHTHFRERVKTPSVPDNIFNAWVDYFEHFGWHEYYNPDDDDDFKLYREIKRVIKYFKIDRLQDVIIFSEIDYTQYNYNKHLRIEEPKFYETVKNLTFDFFAEHNFEYPEANISYGGDFDEGWALGRLSKEGEPEYKTVMTKFGPFTGNVCESIPVTLYEYEGAIEKLKKQG